MADCRYISCSCNRSPNCVSWSNSNLLIYGGCHSVIVSHAEDLAVGKESCISIKHSLAGHSHRVNCVRWMCVPDGQVQDEFISCSTDKCVCVWRCSGDSAEEVSCIGVLSGHTAAVTSGASISLSSEITWVASVSADSTLRLWRRSGQHAEFTSHQTISYGSGFALDAAWGVLPDTGAAILAVARDNHVIQLLGQSEGEFVTVMKLAGHEDWVRGLEFALTDDGVLMLASCSQDTFIRLWRIEARASPGDSPGDSGEDAAGASHEIRLAEARFAVGGGGRQYAVIVESVLAGHDNWVFSARWQPARGVGATRHQPLSLLSASMDKTVIIWQPDLESGVWTEQVRVGEVGGNTLGFYGGVWGPGGRTVLAHGYQGALHVWRLQEDGCWWPGVTVCGHYDAVHDIVWEPTEGRYLVSVSADQTTRLHGYWRTVTSPRLDAWHEIARPQVHGYDMQCVAMLGRYTYAAGADEKVVRAFAAPRNFIENLGRICGYDVSSDVGDMAPEGASVPALGLSNKAVFPGGPAPDYDPRAVPLAQNDQYADAYFVPITVSEPPTEGNLLQNTLWPETQKLYGHGYELFAMAGLPAERTAGHKAGTEGGPLLATACRATAPAHAAVILWDMSSGQQVCELGAHSLTVTQLAFSHDGTRLLSVSRDRTWAVFRRRGDEQQGPLYAREAWSDKTCAVHARIIWGCGWSHDDAFFVTVSRDKKAVVWGAGEAAGSPSCLGRYRAWGVLTEIPEPITAVDFAPVFVAGNRYLMALGTESGRIHLYTWGPPGWQAWLQLDHSAAHHLCVKRVKFCPVAGDRDTIAGDRDIVADVRDMTVKDDQSQAPSTHSDRLELASCGADHMVKIYSLDLNSVPAACS